MFNFLLSYFKIFSLVLICVGVVACSSGPPKDITNSCKFLDDRGSWYDALSDSREKWGTPIHVQLAIMRQESSFKRNARTEREYILWIIPWGRKSSAYGYAQVKDGTWKWYQEKTGNTGADRDNFRDATDFIGWYTHVSQRSLGISKWDAYNQYLAYHEGHGGWKRKTYLKKPWLMKVARKVEGYAKTYAAQLKRCEDDLDSWSLWPF